MKLWHFAVVVAVLGLASFRLSASSVVYGDADSKGQITVTVTFSVAEIAKKVALAKDPISAKALANRLVHSKLLTVVQESQNIPKIPPVASTIDAQIKTLDDQKAALTAEKAALPNAVDTSVNLSASIDAVKLSPGVKANP